MRVEYINPFVETSYRVLKEVLGGAEVKRGELSLKSVAMPVMGVAALVGLAGDVEGRVLFDMTYETALNLASKMNGETLTQFDDLVKATISELANLITAQAVTKLHELGWTHKVELEEGVKLAYEWFKENVDHARMNGR